MLLIVSAVQCARGRWQGGGPGGRARGNQQGVARGGWPPAGLAAWKCKEALLLQIKRLRFEYGSIFL